jgi:hypothetical protein
MQDFFDTANSLANTPQQIDDTFESIYGFSPRTGAFMGVNLQWPKFDLPLDYPRYFLSWHTEQFDVRWLRAQAQRVHPRPVLVAYDGTVDSTIFPDNVEFVRFITWHLQLDQLVQRFGVSVEFVEPCYKISSLSFRVSQYKNYITAYLLKHTRCSELLLTYHNKLGKQEDLHGYPKGLPWLDDLDIAGLVPTWINFKDDYSWDTNQPVDNGGWNIPPYMDALVNCTNESFHYSRSEIDGTEFVFPGPYLTEKTWKPLLAARPFLAVGQYRTYASLQELGMKFDYGFPIDFDTDSGDLTRIKGIFESVDVILSKSMDELFDQSRASVIHNARMIHNGEFAHNCQLVNQDSLEDIRAFLEPNTVDYLDLFTII